MSGAFAILWLFVVARVSCEEDPSGPFFFREPPSHVDFSNSTGAVIECAARGHPSPEILWLRDNGNAIGDVPGLRQVLPNGTLIFPPFRAEDYRQDVHAQVYRCMAKNSYGTIHSRDTRVRAVVSQAYSINMSPEEYVIRGNNALLKCLIPSYVTEFVEVVSWLRGSRIILPRESDKDVTVVHQFYEVDVGKEYVIRGNSALLKCLIPSFVVDFVEVIRWDIINGASHFPGLSSMAVDPEYHSVVPEEFAIRGNNVIMKCSIPSFVAEFVVVIGWVTSTGQSFYLHDGPSNEVVDPDFGVKVHEEYVIKGNNGLLKCTIPSFVAEFVSVIQWIEEPSGVAFFADSPSYVIAQLYEIETHNGYVIRGNHALLKCEIPSFVADFVEVESWVDSDGRRYYATGTDLGGTVVTQDYLTRVIDEIVLRGNSATMKCLIPSFVTDFVEVSGWLDDSGALIVANPNFVVHQYYEPQVYDTFVINGNSALLKCHIPSFVDSHVSVVSWETSDGQIFLFNPMQNPDGKYLVLPSGELHIRDVGPEDGEKSYQCQTKHRLTGETRLSATAGRLVITEPRSASSPRFREATLPRSELVSQPLALICPAQAYPLPDFRTTFQHCSSGEGFVLERLQVDHNFIPTQCIALSCPRISRSFIKLPMVQFPQKFPQKRNSKWLLGLLGSLLRSIVQDKVTLSLSSATRGSVAPKIPELKRGVVVEANSAVSIPCPGQAPRGSVAPKIPDERRLGVAVEANSPVSIACPGQGFPVPTFSGSMAPTADVPKEQLRGSVGFLNRPLNLICTAQGFPIPVIRFRLHLSVSSLITTLVPRGSMAPTADVPNKQHKGSVGFLNRPLNLICTAQGFPIPVISGSVAPTASVPEQQLKGKEARSTFPLSLICNGQGYPAPDILLGRLPLRCQPQKNSLLKGVSEWLESQSTSFAMHEDSPFQQSEPRGSGAATVSVPEEQLVRGRIGEEGLAVNMICNARGSPLPVVSSRPTVSVPEEQLLKGGLGGRGSSVSLICNGQGYPRPSMRPPFHVLHLHFHVPLLIFPHAMSSHNPRGSVPPRMTVSDEQLSGRQGEAGKPINLLCNGQGHEVPTFRWFKIQDGKRNAVSLNERVKQVGGTLLIKEARVEDSGKYLCVVNNSVGGESVETMLTVTAPLSANLEPRSQTVDFGRSASLSCTVRGNPVQSVLWYHNGERLDHKGNELKIESIKKDDKGMYQCFVENDRENAQSTAELKLGGRFEPPQLVYTFKERTLKPGTPTHLQCTATGDPTPDIKWTLDGIEVKDERYQIRQLVSVNGEVIGHLNISSTRTDDGGLYSCTAESNVGSVTHKARVNVFGAPIIRPMADRKVVAGETLVVHCPAAGYPIESIMWERANRILPINGRQKVFANGTMIIENLQTKHDEGLYTCVAKNSHGYTVKGNLNVQVMVVPVITPFFFGGYGDSSMLAGESVQVTCFVARGDEPLTIQWNFHGKNISNHMGMSTTKIGKRASMLIIDRLSAAHSGSYTCKARNLGGEASHTAQLMVKDPPEILAFSFGRAFLEAGESAQAACFVPKGSLPLTIQWSFSGKNVSSHMGMSTSKVGPRSNMLLIDRVTEAHTGNYTLPPEVPPFGFSRDVMEAGDSAQVMCFVRKGDLPIAIQWSFYGKDVVTSMGISTTKVGSRSSVLFIERVAETHTGNYTCTARNSAGEASYTAQLVINVPPKVTSFAFSKPVMEAGENAQVACFVSAGHPPLHIQWTFHGRNVSSHMGMSTTKIGTHASMLLIEHVTEAHSGSYTLPPEIKAFSFTEEATEAGNEAQVTCWVPTGDLPITITWTFHGRNVSSQMGISTFKVGSRSSILNIDRITAAHAGVYTCRARNQVGEAVHSAPLEVNVPPTIKEFEFTEEASQAGSQAQVYCWVPSGDLPLSITWSFHGQNVSTQMGISTIKVGSRSSALSIDPVTAGHAGVYTCRAKNRAGEDVHSATLSVNGTRHTGPKIAWMIEVSLRISLYSLTHPFVAFLHVTFIDFVFYTPSYLSVVSPPTAHTVLPEIVSFEFTEAAKEAGSQASLYCFVPKGDLPIAITWTFHGGNISSEMGFSTVKVGLRSSALSINRVTAAHAGVYTCQARNAAGEDTHSAQLLVNGAYVTAMPPRIAPFHFTDDARRAGGQAQLMCWVPEGDIPVTITWTFHGRNVSNQMGISTMKVGGRSSALNIDHVTAGHAGVYTCQARNFAGETSYSASLDVMVPPRISDFEFVEASKEAGNQASVYCWVPEGDLPMTITWTFHGRNLSSQMGISTVKVGLRSSILNIDRVMAGHAGVYTCQARNAAGEDSHSTTLEVYVPPEIKEFTFSEESSQSGVPPRIKEFEFSEEASQAGAQASLYCWVPEGDLPLTITWTFHGRNISSQMGISTFKVGKRSSALNIDPVTASHAGTYTCRASNDAGNDKKSAELSVMVPPEIKEFTFTEEASQAGNEAQVQCWVPTGDLPMSITWTFHGKNVSSQMGISTGKFGSRSSLLNINRVAAQHAGTYTCTARNAAGEDVHSTVLRVLVPPRINDFYFTAGAKRAGSQASVYCWVPEVPPKIISFAFPEDSKRAGSEAQITCFVSVGDLPVSITWTFHGIGVAPQMGISTVKVGKRTSILAIENVTADHAGTYTCQARNEAGEDSHSAILDVHVPPRIRPFSFGDKPLKSGEMAQVSCVVDIEGDQQLQISWHFHGRNLTTVATQNGISTARFGKRSSILTIETVQADHSGIYTCVARSLFGKDVYSATLQVNVPPKIRPFSFGDYPLEEGSVAQIQCLVQFGNGDLGITWHFHGQNLSSETGISTSRFGRQSSILTIDRVSAQHAGTYTCVARNRIGQDSFSTSLQVNVPPAIIPFSFRDGSIAGDRVQVACIVREGDLPIALNWHFHGQNISSPHMGISTYKISRFSSILAIERLEYWHSGTYTCVARNHAGEESYSATLVVQVSPEIMPFTFGNGVDPFEEGSLAQVSCLVIKGDEPLTISWHFHGKNVTSQESIATLKVGGRTSILTIERTLAAHSGTYTCVAKNLIGETSASAELRVNGLPKVV
ncbi:unnamed protein product [Cyprideis torosa]|uniref:Uncharacterized protein n=1 Tax=Cyprideis torosa TaxID=163714 RepID=A0A7R8W9E6_9CRUS|nr:unnamed protein product [Cyprideis torosa]CAG0885273.1 unnamed protein product [Cyprideis torosa]